jgi:hypothetical protein
LTASSFSGGIPPTANLLTSSKMTSFRLITSYGIFTGTGITKFIGSSYKRVSFVGGKEAEALHAVEMTGERGTISAAVFSSTVIGSGSAGPPSSPVSPILDQGEAQGGRQRLGRAFSQGNVFTKSFRPGF